MLTPMYSCRILLPVAAVLRILVSGAYADAVPETAGLCRDAPIHLAEMSDRLGYELSGEYGFVGSLTKEQHSEATWRLEGEFSFPTAGYSVGPITALVAESYPEQVSVTIVVTPPPPGSIVAQVITRVPVVLSISASNVAFFSLRTRTCDAGRDGTGRGCSAEGEARRRLNHWLLPGLSLLVLMGLTRQRR